MKYRKTTPENFWLRVSKTRECWEWTGSKFLRGGYGQVGYKGKNCKAHRLAWIFTYGEIPEGLDVCHTCDNPPCCRPDHLFLGTRKDNMEDCCRKGRTCAKITNKQATEIRKLYKKGALQIDLAAKFGVRQTEISRIVNFVTFKVIE